MTNFAKILAVVGMMLVTSTGAQAAAGDQACKLAVDSIKSEWKVVDFPTASKPTAVRVEGKYGHENTAAQIAYMQEEIKKAESDCHGGNPTVAMQRVASVRQLLDSHGISQETVNAAMAPLPASK